MSDVMDIDERIPVSTAATELMESQECTPLSNKEDSLLSIALMDETKDSNVERHSDPEDDERVVIATRPHRNPRAPEQQNIINKARGYQQELFERAKDENIIAVLDTGSGKTLVAALLIRHVLQQELIDQSRGESPRIIFFLVNSVHLVHQQANFLRSNISDPVVALHGHIKVDLWTRTEWEHIYQEKKVVVCTAAILNRCLWNRYLSMAQISLIVMDEAHHCKKNHPYSRIIRDFYVKHPGPKPRIFSMTASPVDSKRDIRQAANELEELLHSKITTTKDSSIFEFAPKPVEEIWKYSPLLATPETDLCHQLRVLCGFVPDLKKRFEYARTAQTELGEWFAIKVWKHAFGSTPQDVATLIRKYETSPEYLALESLELKTARIKSIERAAALVQRYTLPTPTSPLAKVSSKVAVLHQEIAKRYSRNPDTRSIVFVTQQMSVMLLREWFNTARIPNVRAGMLIGVTQAWLDQSSRDRQERQMDDFRCGTTNLMFATSVAEEGIDIPQCNLVVRFDICTNPIQYIQSKGRARMKDSVFAQMAEDGNFDHQAMITYAVDTEAYIKLYCSKLSPDRLLGHGTNLRKLMMKDALSGSFVTKAGTLCNLFNSLTILSRYASTLRHLGTTGAEVYEEIPIPAEVGGFRYAVHLPTTPQSPIKGVLGAIKQNKVLAKRSAAYRCVLRLRNAGLLDEELKSTFAKLKPHNANARLAVNEKKDSYDMKTKPDFWSQGIGSIPTSLVAYIIVFTAKTPLQRPLQSLILLTRNALPNIPEFPIFVEAGVEVAVSIVSVSEAIEVSDTDLELATTFTLNAVFADVFAKIYELDSMRVSYWLLPAAVNVLRGSRALNKIVDMEALRNATKERIPWSAGSSAEIWQDQFLIDPLNGRDHFFTHKIVPGASIFDPVVSEMPKVPSRSRETVIDFSDSHWRASRKKQVNKYDLNQPVLDADLIMVRRNFLDRDLKRDYDRISCRVAPQPLLIARISPSLAATCLIWPSIIHRLESYLIALEAFEKIGITDMPAHLALEACTKGSGSDDEDVHLHSEAHSMGKNYERLEFIGDSLLKMMTTITVFNRTNCDEEGMHCRRMDILCNRRLFQVSTEQYGLYQYIRTQPFNRTSWYPQFLTQLQGRQIKHEAEIHNLGMKTMADVSEAMIGAAFLANREAPQGQKFDKGIQAITRLVSSEDHAIRSWSEIQAMYPVSEWQLVMDDPIAADLARKVEDRVGYKFKHPRLCRSALTHASETMSPVPDLQRMEFLGDACLDWVCIDWLFQTNPDRNPQWLTEHKMAMVSNKFLAALAVVLDLDKMILTPSAALIGDITSFALKIRTAYPEAKRSGNRSFWTRVENPPKSLSDLVESTLGAILIDSDFDYSEIEKFFNRHVLWFFENINDYDGFANRQPTTYAFKRLSQEYGCRDFIIRIEESAEATQAVQKHATATPQTEASLANPQIEEEVTASFIIHNQTMCSSTGISARHAKVRVSRMALRILEQLTVQDFRVEFGCTCRRVDFSEAELGNGDEIATEDVIQLNGEKNGAT